MGVYRDKQSGKYGIRFEYNGRQIRKIIGLDKRMAQEALKEVKSEIAIRKMAHQNWEVAKKVQRYQKPRTFADAAKDYMDERANYKASSIASYQSILNSYLLPEFGRDALRDITESWLRKFMVNLSKKVSESRVNTVMQLLRSILDQECRQGAIDRDPSRAIKRMEEPKVDIDPLSEDELAIALAAIEPLYRPLFTVLAYTGARPNEMLALRWGDIDWRKETIKISKGRVRGVEGLPKTRSSQRVIVMTKPVVEALVALKDSTLVSKDGYVFTKKDGQPIDKHLDRIWARALKRAGLRHRPSYQLRHTFATLCIVKGFPLPFIAKALGHSTIDTLVRHYAGWIDDASKSYEAQLREAFRMPVENQPHIRAISV